MSRPHEMAHSPTHAYPHYPGDSRYRRGGMDRNLIVSADDGFDGSDPSAANSNGLTTVLDNR